MRLGEEVSRRTRTKVTMKIAWLLLSLSFLFHSVSSDDPSPVTVSTIASGGDAGTEAQPTVNNKTESPVLHTIVAQTPGNLTNAANAGTNVTDFTQKAVTIVTSTPPSATLPATTLSPSTNPSPAALTTAPAVSTVTVDTVQVQTYPAPVPSKSPGTEPTNTPTGRPTQGDTSNITKLSTDGTTGGQQATTNPVIVTTTEKGETTVMTTARNEPATTKPSGRPWTSGTHPVRSTAGPHVNVNPGGGEQTTPQTTTATNSTAIPSTEPRPNTFQFSLNSKYEKVEDKEMAEVCKRLMANLRDGNCTLIWSDKKNGKVHFDSVEINGIVKTNLANQYYEEIAKKPADSKTLIAILASCGALLIMIFILAICASHHRRPYNENQQHLTEELHTVENGYHDNPTLEVMEVQPEMQEKKVVLNGEFNDSWIVPIENLLKEDAQDEEDTHL